MKRNQRQGDYIYLLYILLALWINIHDICLFNNLKDDNKVNKSSIYEFCIRLIKRAFKLLIIILFMFVIFFMSRSLFLLCNFLYYLCFFLLFLQHFGVFGHLLLLLLEFAIFELFFLRVIIWWLLFVLVSDLLSVVIILGNLSGMLIKFGVAYFNLRSCFYIEA